MAYFDKYGVEFSDDHKTLEKFSHDFHGEYIIPEGVTDIGNHAFYYCTDLESIYLPSSVIYIEYHAFSFCSSLKEINVADENTEYCSLEGILYDKSKTAIICYPGGKQGVYFMPNSISCIGEGAFNGCIGLKEISLSTHLSHINGRTFRGCKFLKRISFSNNIKGIGIAAFEGCENLKEILVPKGQKERFAQMDGLRDLKELIVETQTLM